MQVCRLREECPEAEKAVASDCIILLPLSALKPEAIIDYHEGTMQRWGPGS